MYCQKYKEKETKILQKPRGGSIKKKKEINVMKTFTKMTMGLITEGNCKFKKSSLME